MRVAVLANANIDGVIVRLSKVHECYRPVGFGGWEAEFIDSNSLLSEFCAEAIILVLDMAILNAGFNKQKLSETVSIIESFCSTHQTISVYVAKLPSPEWNISTIEELKKINANNLFFTNVLLQVACSIKNLFILDIVPLLHTIGPTFFSSKMKYIGGIPFSFQGEKLISQYFDRVLKAQSGYRRKCLVLDLDNTLWGGVVGEVGIQGIDLAPTGSGGIYYDFQKQLIKIKNSGVLLAIASKNNQEDGMGPFLSNSNCLLKLTDFSSIQISWEEKTKSLIKIAEELNVGLDSLVFVDDNPVERAAIQTAIPDVAVPEFPMDPVDLPTFAFKVFNEYFLSIKLTDEDIGKSQQYAENSERLASRSNALSLEAFLEGLQMKIRIRHLTSDDISRAAQLTQKTNQFNLTTWRLSENELSGMMASDKYRMYIMSAEDRFGDSGKIGFAIVERISIAEALLKCFLMSCRVMGRKIENAFIQYIENDLIKQKVNVFKTFYSPTAKNIPVQNLLHEFGYTLEDDQIERKSYTVDLKVEIKRQFFGELV